jgi:hypothetical protein
MKLYIVKDNGWEWSIDIGIFKNKDNAIMCKETFEKYGKVKTSLGDKTMFHRSSRVDIVEVLVDD